MYELQEKYAKVLLESCLKVEKGQPLFISANIERIDFVRIVTKVAYELGIKDIYYDISDPYLKHEALKYLVSGEVSKQLVSFDVWTRQYSSVNLTKLKKADCPSCGKNPTYPFLSRDNQLKTAVNTIDKWNR